MSKLESKRSRIDASIDNALDHIEAAHEADDARAIKLARIDGMPKAIVRLIDSDRRKANRAVFRAVRILAEARQKALALLLDAEWHYDAIESDVEQVAGPKKIREALAEPLARRAVVKDTDDDTGHTAAARKRKVKSRGKR